MRVLELMACALLLGCSAQIDTLANPQGEATDLSMRPKPDAITQEPWREVVINVERFEDIAPFFTQIGGYEILKETDTQKLLGAKGADGGFIRLQKISAAEPARPARSRSWDKGCYFSLMIRAKNLPSIIEEAKTLGWTPLTEMAYLEFGPSKLNIIVLTHETGVRVQLYERLTTALPEGFTPFERLSRPFNIMQMVEDRDRSYDFFQQKMGFDSFYFGGPTVSETPQTSPLGIPLKLTTEIPYCTAIVTPKVGLEYGRIEMIDVEGMDGGVDYSARCDYNHTGIIAVRFYVEDIGAVRKDFRARDVKIHKSSTESLTIKTPDGSNIEFYQK